jgi:hypothetical protein
MGKSRGNKKKEFYSYVGFILNKIDKDYLDEIDLSDFTYDTFECREDKTIKFFKQNKNDNTITLLCECQRVGDIIKLKTKYTKEEHLANKKKAITKYLETIDAIYKTNSELYHKKSIPIAVIKIDYLIVSFIHIKTKIYYYENSQLFY